jgi:hypothetical protein
MDRFRDSDPRRRWWRHLELGFLLMLASCSQLPTSSVTSPRIPAGEARLWFYRDGGPYEIQASPYLRLNGRVTGISEPDGTFYRDVTPRPYVVTVDSYLDNYVDQFTSIDLAAGQEAYVKVLSMRRDKASGETGFARDIFFTRIIPADTAQAEAAPRRFYGGG